MRSTATLTVPRSRQSDNDNKKPETKSFIPLNGSIECLVRLSVNLPAVSNSHNQNDQLLIPNFIDDTVVTDSDPPGITTTELLASRWSWHICQGTDGINDSILLSDGDSAESFLSRFLDEDRTGHFLTRVLIWRTAASNGNADSFFAFASS